MLEQTAAPVLLDFRHDETRQAPRLLRALHELLPVLAKHLMEQRLFGAVALMALGAASSWMTHLQCRGEGHARPSPEPCRALASASPPSIANESERAQRALAGGRRQPIASRQLQQGKTPTASNWVSQCEIVQFLQYWATKWLHSLGMTPLVRSVAGLVFYSADAERLVAFYRDTLGIPLEPAAHGGMGRHFEGFSGLHVAVWDSRLGHAPGPAGLVPVFLTDDLDRATGRLGECRTPQLHKPLDLGEGKRVAGFKDPDHRVFRIIELE